jgi:hypothetical protein
MKMWTSLELVKKLNQLSQAAALGCCVLIIGAVMLLWVSSQRVQTLHNEKIAALVAEQRESVDHKYKALQVKVQTLQKELVSEQMHAKAERATAENLRKRIAEVQNQLTATQQLLARQNPQAAMANQLNMGDAAAAIQPSAVEKPAPTPAGAKEERASASGTISAEPAETAQGAGEAAGKDTSRPRVDEKSAEPTAPMRQSGASTESTVMPVSNPLPGNATSAVTDTQQPHGTPQSPPSTTQPTSTDEAVTTQ